MTFYSATFDIGVNQVDQIVITLENLDFKNRDSTGNDFEYHWVGTELSIPWLQINTILWSDTSVVTPGTVG